MLPAVAAAATILAELYILDWHDSIKCIEQRVKRVKTSTEEPMNIENNQQLPHTTSSTVVLTPLHADHLHVRASSSIVNIPVQSSLQSQSSTFPVTTLSSKPVESVTADRATLTTASDTSTRKREFSIKNLDETENDVGQEKGNNDVSIHQTISKNPSYIFEHKKSQISNALLLLNSDEQQPETPIISVSLEYPPSSPKCVNLKNDSVDVLVKDINSTNNLMKKFSLEQLLTTQESKIKQNTSTDDNNFKRNFHNISVIYDILQEVKKKSTPSNDNSKSCYVPIDEMSPLMATVSSKSKGTVCLSDFTRKINAHDKPLKLAKDHSTSHTIKPLHADGDHLSVSYQQPFIITVINDNYERNTNAMKRLCVNANDPTIDDINAKYRLLIEKTLDCCVDQLMDLMDCDTKCDCISNNAPVDTHFVEHETFQKKQNRFVRCQAKKEGVNCQNCTAELVVPLYPINTNHGRDVEVTNQLRDARRLRLGQTLLFSNRRLVIDELIVLSFLKIDDKYLTTIRFGLTTMDPRSMKQTDIPSRIPDRSKDYDWYSSQNIDFQTSRVNPGANVKLTLTRHGNLLFEFGNNQTSIIENIDINDSEYWLCIELNGLIEQLQITEFINVHTKPNIRVQSDHASVIVNEPLKNGMNIAFIVLDLDHLQTDGFSLSLIRDKNINDRSYCTTLKNLHLKIDDEIMLSIRNDQVFYSKNNNEPLPIFKIPSISKNNYHLYLDLAHRLTAIGFLEASYCHSNIPQNGNVCTNARNCITWPCRHMEMCYECGKMLINKPCPVDGCRKIIQRIIHNITFSKSNTCARRDKLNNNLIFTNRPVMPNEIVQFLIEETAKGFYGTIRIGLTTIDPATYTQETLPKTISSQDNQHQWFLPSPRSPPNILVDREIRLVYTPEGDIYFDYCGNGFVKQLSFTPVSKDLWCVIDLNGQIVQMRLIQTLSIVMSSHVDRALARFQQFYHSDETTYYGSYDLSPGLIEINNCDVNQIQNNIAVKQKDTTRKSSMKINENLQRCMCLIIQILDMDHTKSSYFTLHCLIDGQIAPNPELSKEINSEFTHLSIGDEIGIRVKPNGCITFSSNNRNIKDLFTIDLTVNDNPQVEKTLYHLQFDLDARITALRFIGLYRPTEKEANTPPPPLGGGCTATIRVGVCPGGKTGLLMPCRHNIVCHDCGITMYVVKRYRRLTTTDECNSSTCNCSLTDNITLNIACDPTTPLTTLPSMMISALQLNITTLKLYSSIINTNGPLSSLPDNICDYPNIQTLILANNSITGILNTSSMSCLQNLLNIDLSYNFIEQLDNNLFIANRQLVTMNFAHNLINVMPTIDGPYFVNFISELTLMDFSFNQIPSVDLWPIFISTGHYMEINLSNNQIANYINTVPIDMIQLPNLPDARYVDLSNNQLTSVSDILLEMYGACATQSMSSTIYFILGLSALELSGNNLTCDCQSYNLLQVIDDPLNPGIFPLISNGTAPLAKAKCSYPVAAIGQLFINNTYSTKNCSSFTLSTDHSRFCTLYNNSDISTSPAPTYWPSTIASTTVISGGTTGGVVNGSATSSTQSNGSNGNTALTGSLTNSTTSLIVGVVLGLAFLIVLVVFLIFSCYWKKYRSKLSPNYKLGERQELNDLERSDQSIKPVIVTNSDISSQTTTMSPDIQNDEMISNQKQQLAEDKRKRIQRNSISTSTCAFDDDLDNETEQQPPFDGSHPPHLKISRNTNNHSTDHLSDPQSPISDHPIDDNSSELSSQHPHENQSTQTCIENIVRRNSLNNTFSRTNNNSQLSSNKSAKLSRHPQSIVTHSGTNTSPFVRGIPITALKSNGANSSTNDTPTKVEMKLIGDKPSPRAISLPGVAGKMYLDTTPFRGKPQRRYSSTLKQQDYEQQEKVDNKIRQRAQSVRTIKTTSNITDINTLDNSKTHVDNIENLSTKKSAKSIRTVPLLNISVVSSNAWVTPHSTESNI
ncbi:unnamed protein product [Didymodactylos carnosus]|uniref:NHR domain-containing protein n=1 Tax=Didymodactylos carnosus TaxID=1234261 RepID=A0A814E093_9BILA|nr:unnamed protein product [Didymodactylos carnosus]CAF3735259.1 unnamed protein product [Didymodactylos carnosus]